MRDIAKCVADTKTLPRSAGAAALVLAVLGLSGCMGTGLGLADASGIDPRATGSVTPQPNGPGMADAATVQGAVSTAEIGAVTAGPIPWANATSGSAGVISSIEETTVEGTVCRQFTTTRHSYQGIAKFDGNTCRKRNGAWYLKSFSPRS